MSTYLVAYASKMGATREIAEAVGTELLAADHRVSVASAGNVGDVRGYDAVVLGSAVYAGRWRGEAVSHRPRRAFWPGEWRSARWPATFATGIPSAAGPA